MVYGKSVDTPAVDPNSEHTQTKSSKANANSIANATNAQRHLNRAIPVVVSEMIPEAQHWNVCGEAENGEEAVEKVRQLKADLIILDMNMPILNGYEAAQEIRRRSPSGV
jgi:CheY-like chemotaxis protein